MSFFLDSSFSPITQVIDVQQNILCFYIRCFYINTISFCTIFLVIMHCQKSATFAIVLKIPKMLLPNGMDLMEKHSSKAYVTYWVYMFINLINLHSILSGD